MEAIEKLSEMQFHMAIWNVLSMLAMACAVAVSFKKFGHTTWWLVAYWSKGLVYFAVAVLAKTILTTADGMIATNGVVTVASVFCLLMYILAIVRKSDGKADKIPTPS